MLRDGSQRKKSMSLLPRSLLFTSARQSMSRDVQETFETYFALRHRTRRHTGDIRDILCLAPPDTACTSTTGIRQE